MIITTEKAVDQYNQTYYKTFINGGYVTYGWTEESAIEAGELWLRQTFMPLPPII